MGGRFAPTPRPGLTMDGFVPGVPLRSTPGYDPAPLRGSKGFAAPRLLGPKAPRSTAPWLGGSEHPRLNGSAAQREKNGS